MLITQIGHLQYTHIELPCRKQATLNIEMLPAKTVLLQERDLLTIHQSF